MAVAFVSLVPEDGRNRSKTCIVGVLIYHVMEPTLQLTEQAVVSSFGCGCSWIPFGGGDEGVN